MTNFARSAKRVVSELLHGRPSEPGPEDIAFAQSSAAKKEEEEKKHLLLISGAAHRYLELMLQDAGLPGEIHQVAGRWCSFWFQDTFFEDVHNDRPFVAQIVGVATTMDWCLQLTLSAGPREIQHIVFRNGGWGFYQTGGGQKILSNFQLL